MESALVTAASWIFGEFAERELHWQQNVLNLLFKALTGGGTGEWWGVSVPTSALRLAASATPLVLLMLRFLGPASGAVPSFSHRQPPRYYYYYSPIAWVATLLVGPLQWLSTALVLGVLLRWPLTTLLLGLVWGTLAWAWWHKHQYHSAGVGLWAELSTADRADNFDAHAAEAWGAFAAASQSLLPLPPAWALIAMAVASWVACAAAADALVCLQMRTQRGLRRVVRRIVRALLWEWPWAVGVQAPLAAGRGIICSVNRHTRTHKAELVGCLLHPGEGPGPKTADDPSLYHLAEEEDHHHHSYDVFQGVDGAWDDDDSELDEDYVFRDQSDCELDPDDYVPEDCDDVLELLVYSPPRRSARLRAGTLRRMKAGAASLGEDRGAS